MSIRRILAQFALFLGSTLLVDISFACMIPYSGEEYDSQLSIEPLDGQQNSFRITAPLQMNDTPLQISLLKWLLHVVPTDRKQPFKEIALKTKGDHLVGEFSTPSKKDAFEITVELWYGSKFGGCPTGAEIVLDDFVE